MAAAAPVLKTPQRSDISNILLYGLGQPESEEDSVEEASLNVTIDKSDYHYYWYLKDPTFLQLMEVSSVIINKLEGTADQLYGDISIGNCVFNVAVFHRDKSSSDDITIFNNNRNQDELLLTGPAQSIAMEADWQQVVMKFTVDNKTYKCLIPFTEYGPVTEYTYFGRLISATISHKALGSITMNYIVFQTAVAAKVEVELLDTDISIDDVYGDIYAYNSQHDLQSCLFHKTKKPVCLTRDNRKHIPLSRSVVALSCDAKLIFSLDLKDSKTGLSFAKICDFTFSVPPKISEPRKIKTFELREHHKVCNKIQINLTWASCFAADQ